MVGSLKALFCQNSTEEQEEERNRSAMLRRAREERSLRLIELKNSPADERLRTYIEFTMTIFAFLLSALAVVLTLVGLTGRVKVANQALSVVVILAALAAFAANFGLDDRIGMAFTPGPVGEPDPSVVATALSQILVAAGMAGFSLTLAAGGFSLLLFTQRLRRAALAMLPLLVVGFLFTRAVGVMLATLSSIAEARSEVEPSVLEQATEAWRASTPLATGLGSALFLLLALVARQQLMTAIQVGVLPDEEE